MKFSCFALILALSALVPQMVCGQETGGVQSFQQDKDSWRRKEASTSRPAVTQKMRDVIPAQALRNITDAEQAFCYMVEGAAPDFKGYSIDGMEITGFCGILNQTEIDLFIEEFLSRDENVSNVVENCIIQPRIMLRFVHGVDFTDVLLSSPCHSFTIFYAGKIKSFNTSPAAKVVDTIVDAYEKRRVNFVSPALLKQVLPIGIPQNDDQRALVREKSAKGPIRNWQTEQPEEKPAETESKGWNRLKFKK